MKLTEEEALKFIEDQDALDAGPLKIDGKTRKRMHCKNRVASKRLGRFWYCAKDFDLEDFENFKAKREMGEFLTRLQVQTT